MAAKTTFFFCALKLVVKLTREKPVSQAVLSFIIQGEMSSSTI